MYFFDSNSFVPIEFVGVHNTSAATPAFHARPTDVPNDARNEEKTDGA